MSALWDIQTAITKKLKNDQALGALVTGIHDQAPRGSDFPYIVIGELTDNPFNTFDRKGSTVTATLHIFSRYKGNKQGLMILERVKELLDYEPLDVNGQTLVYCKFENATTLTEGDRQTRHIPTRFEVVTQNG